MTITTAIKTGLKKSLTFTGRTTRAEFWWFFGAFVAFWLLTLILMRQINVALGPTSPLKNTFDLAFNLFLLSWVPLFAAGYRRNIDAGVALFFTHILVLTFATVTILHLIDFAGFTFPLLANMLIAALFAFCLSLVSNIFLWMLTSVPDPVSNNVNSSEVPS